MSMNTENSYEKFITEKVLKDSEIINFIRENNLTHENIEQNLEKFYQYYISKDAALNIDRKPKLVINEKNVNIVYSETQEYKNKRLAQQLNKRIKTEFIPKKVLTYTFHNLSKSKEKGILATEIIKNCKNILDGQGKKGVYIYGPTGMGKTYLMGCIYNYLKEQGKEPTILYYPEFIRKIKSKISSNNYDQYIDLVRADEILIIDDIGAENITEFIRDEVLGPIINYREAENLPTFFSSNLSLDDLATLLANSRNSVDQTKALRIIQRIKSLSTVYFLNGDNEREYNN